MAFSTALAPKGVTLWSYGLNPWKVDLLLRELQVPFTTKFVSKPKEKPKEFLEQFPNARFPAVIDHSHEDLCLFESNAIIEYLMEIYGAASKLNPISFLERQRAREWLSFQASGQGVAFQAAAYWKFQASGSAPAAADRSLAEVLRILKVVDDWLTKQKSAGLIAGRITYVDLTWFWWNEFAFTVLFRDRDLHDQFPALMAWHGTLKAIPSVQASIQARKLTL